MGALYSSETLASTYYNANFHRHQNLLKLKIHGLSLRANYTDRATAACRRSDCQLLRVEGATCSAWRIPTAVYQNLLAIYYYYLNVLTRELCRYSDSLRAGLDFCSGKQILLIPVAFKEPTQPSSQCSFPRSKATGAWNWPLTSIWCWS
jgi:hypothetical protein